MNADEWATHPAPSPRWTTLERRDVRLRVDQLEALAALRRDIMRNRRTRLERITDASLIRIAVDLLLSDHNRLHMPGSGDTEDELRDFVCGGQGSRPIPHKPLLGFTNEPTTTADPGADDREQLRQ